MIAGQCKGDYHDNFDTKSFFKWMVSFLITYPAWCEQMQTKLDDDVGHVMFPEDEPAFFDRNTYVSFNVIPYSINLFISESAQQEV